jgi:hypothetical protein
MLNLEAYGISKKRPKLNEQFPKVPENYKHEKGEWKVVDLSFLHYRSVDWSQDVLWKAGHEYYYDAMDHLGIPWEYLHDTKLKYKLDENCKISIVFDDSGMALLEFLEYCGFNQYDNYVNAAYRKSGLINPSAYFSSLDQFK